MAFWFLDTSARSTWAAGTAQLSQLQALAALWSADVSVRVYSSGGTHLQTVTYGAWVVDTSTTPYSLRLGAYSARTHYSNGTAAYCVCAVPSGSDILRADVALDGAVSDPGGRVRLDIGTRLRIYATASLPETDLPAWRSAMTVEDRIYYITAQPPSEAPALTLPTKYGPGSTLPDTFGGGWFVMGSYSSGTLLADVGGPHGTMVYGGGGHAVIANHLLGLDLNSDAPTWSWWHQPTYKTSDTGSADLYYAPSEETALVAGPRGTAARIVPDSTGGSGSEVATAALWDRQFPVAFDGWIFPRKLTTGQMGDNVPHGFRYSCCAYVPAGVTGTEPMFFTITGAAGPFDQNAAPATVSDSDWFDASVLVTGTRKKYPYYFRNCTSGAWTKHEWQPDGMQLANSFSSPPVGVFTDTKRIYVVGGNSAGAGYYYIDLSAGFGSQTVSSYISAQDGGGSHINRHGYCAGAFSEGDPLGRHFMVTLSNEASHLTKLVVYDFDSNTSFRIDLASAGLSYTAEDERLGISYDPANQRVLLLVFDNTTGTPSYWSITVPSTLTNSAGWVASQRSLAYDDAGMATTIFQSGQSNQDNLAGFYGKTRLHPTLGCILVPSSLYRMTAFVPSV